MGSEITKKKFKETDFQRFRQRLQAETDLLKQWIHEARFSDNGCSTGIELEAWLLDKNYQPSPKNKSFLKKLNHPQVVHELARYCIELNGSPQKLNHPQCLLNIHNELKEIWNLCEVTAKKMDTHVLMAGTPATLHDSMLTASTMSDSKRFFALNEQMMSSMKNNPIEVHITGKEKLRLTRHDIMLASSTAALHIQFKFPISKGLRYFNATQAISAPMVALAANSPFLFGRDLWLESRVPIFEHALNSAPTLKAHGQHPRVFFGSGFLNNSLFEYFQKNITQHPTLLAANLDSNLEDMAHLSLHNGTIWRWNRLVVGKNDSGIPHFRIEHRSTSSGPTLIDTIANLAFFIGCIHALAQEPNPVELELSYPLVEKNFYKGARKGLNAQLNWRRGQPIKIKELLLQELIPKAKWGLQQLGIDAADIELYIDKIITQRVRSGQTGAEWQRQFVKKFGENFSQLTATYLEHQKEGLPVHQWKV